MFGRAGINFGRMGAVRPYWALAGSSLDLDFVNARGWQDGAGQKAASDFLTTTRASNAYADNSAGVWSLFGSGVPRITNKGMLVEESRTNSIRNNSMQGASAPSTLPTNWFLTNAGSGLTRTVVGVGTENGIDYIDVRYSGTTSAQVDIAIRPEATTTQVPAVNGQSWTSSVFLSLSGANPFSVQKLYVNEMDGAGAQINAYNSDVVFGTSSMRRNSVTGTFVSVSAAYAFFTTIFRIPTSTAVDFTLRIGWPQLELGSFATSPIRTTSAAATRAADAITTARSGTASGTIIIQGRTAPGVGSSNQALWQWDDGTSNNRMVLYRDNTGDLIYEVTAGGVTQAYFDLGAVASDTAFKVAASWATDAFDVALNGTAASSDTSGTVPTGLTTIRHGSDTSGSQWGGLILRESILPVASTAAQLEALSA